MVKNHAHSMNNPKTDAPLPWSAKPCSASEAMGPGGHASHVVVHPVQVARQRIDLGMGVPEPQPTRTVKTALDKCIGLSKLAISLRSIRGM